LSGVVGSGVSLRFSARLDCVNHVLAEGEQVADCVEVQVMTMDALVGADVPALIKIDVEGHEMAVLRGAERTIADPLLLAVIMETNGSGVRYGIDDAELVSIMRANGFAAFGYDPFARRLVNLDGAGGNTVFVRDVETVSQRVATAQRFKLINGEI